VLRGLRTRFFEPRGRDWFREGLVIASGSQKTVEPALEKISRVFPFVKWDLLSRREYESFPIRSSFIIRRPLGGLRLLWRARKSFEIVILMGARGERELRSYCWVALLIMAPRRFFVFVERGEGFWLSIDDAEALRDYYPRLTWLADGLRPGPRSFASQISAQARATRTYAAAAAFAMKIVRCGRIAVGAALIFLSVVALGFLRLLYDAHLCRYRLLQTTTGPRKAEGSHQSVTVSSPPVVFEVHPKMPVSGSREETELRWAVTVPKIEIRVDSASGQTVCSGGASGTWFAGRLDRGTIYYLQDASRGDAFRPERTLARLAIEGASAASRDLHDGA
jgi:hypothetical protein